VAIVPGVLPGLKYRHKTSRDREDRYKMPEQPELLPRKTSNRTTVHIRTKTDTGRRGEYPKALERTVFKELGNFTPYVRNKGSLPSTILLRVASIHKENYFFIHFSLSVTVVLRRMVLGGRSEVALATVYQKHSSLLNLKDDV
jgi:hypothetical protein